MLHNSPRLLEALSQALHSNAFATIDAALRAPIILPESGPTFKEFESYELNREKVIAGDSKAVIFIGPLDAGDYPFFGEFNPKTAQGVIRAE